MGKNNKLNLNNGFTLVEVLVAISIFSVSVLAMLSVLSQGISDTNYVKTKIVASYLAQEGVEYIRNIRDTIVLYDIPNSWTKFRSAIDACGSPGNVKTCYFDDRDLNFAEPSLPMTKISILACGGGSCPALLYDSGTGKYGYASGVNSGFVRSLQAVYPSGPDDDIKIFSRVSWTQSSGTYNVVFSENLFNWVE